MRRGSASGGGRDHQRALKNAEIEAERVVRRHETPRSSITRPRIELRMKAARDDLVLGEEAAEKREPGQGADSR